MIGMKSAALCGAVASWLVAALIAGTACAAEPPAGRLILAGSGSNLPLVRLLVRSFQKSHPEVRIEVPASIGSSSGIRAAANGAIAIGLISRPLKETEKGLGLTVRHIARTPMVIAVHPTVAEDAITSRELLDIYRCSKRTWKSGSDIIVLTREPGDSSIEVLVKGVPGFKEVYQESQQAKRWTTLLKDLVMNETLGKTANAIGLSDLGAITVERHPIKQLKFNGVAPTLKNLENGSYTMYKTLSFVFLQEKLHPAAAEFLAFTRSKEGQRIMRANGYRPEG